jgi:hypothetical protein
MRLLEDFTYVDHTGERWAAVTNDTVDGATIPKAFWSIVGGPYEGKYRAASVVHDAACVRKTRPWQRSHQMFYEASLAGGVKRSLAKWMYAAVYIGGPRWGADTLGRQRFSDNDLARLLQYVVDNPDVPLTEIEQVTPQRLQVLEPTLRPEMQVLPADTTDT